MGKQIPPERQAAYYGGMVLTGIGVVMCFGTIISFIVGVKEQAQNHNDGSGFFITFFVGMILAAIGAVIQNIGGKGLAGSGVILDPEKAREDLEPYSRMAGGMVKDALDEADVDLGAKSEKIIVIKCQKCGKLNEETAKFCNECGSSI